MSVSTLLAGIGTACGMALAGLVAAQLAIIGTRTPPSHFEPFFPRIGKSLKPTEGNPSTVTAGLSLPLSPMKTMSVFSATPRSTSFWRTWPMAMSMPSTMVANAEWLLPVAAE